MWLIALKDTKESIQISYKKTPRTLEPGIFDILGSIVTS